jgi:O-antigen ligase
MLVSERRAGFIAVIVAFLALAVTLFFVKRRAFMFLAVPLMITGAVYMPLFWNNTGTLGQPARAVRSISDPDPRDAASNEWRGLEAINVRATIASDPLMGIGFGRPFLQVVTVPDISFFEFWNYESHHDILWIWMKTGALGFIAFFMLVCSTLARSAWLIKTRSDPDIRAFAVIAMSAVLMSVTFCYVDLGLTSARIPIILGLSIGTLSVLDRLRDDNLNPTEGRLSS